MNENHLWRLKNKLKAKFYVMNDSWLKDCVEFFIEDKAPHEITDRHILEFVESQWQLSNLREISNENGCLPRNLVQQMHIVLTGTYILQVDMMYDIASSKYKQLCQIRKINNDNLEVTENEKPNEWEPKGRRMIQWSLTDGVQDITAIEYMPLKQVTSTLLPGYKVMIIGPVDCRRGIILLEDGKYREIGGEVEAMLQPNALENVLARALDEPENPDPYHDNGLFRDQDQNNQNLSPNPTNGGNLFDDDDFEEAVVLEAVTAIEQQNQEAVKIVQNHPASTKQQKQDTQIEQQYKLEVDIVKEFFEDDDIVFEPLENCGHSRPNEVSSMKSMQVSSSRMETNNFEEKDDMIIEKTSISAPNFRSKPSFPTKSNENEDITEESRITCQPQSRNPIKFRNETEVCSSLRPSTSKLTNDKVKEHTFVGVSTKRNEKSVASASRTVKEIPKTMKISNFFTSPPPPKVCDLSDVLCENITGTIHRTVRAQVKSFSTLTKQGKCWAVTALITDRTSSVEICFDSEILEKFLGFTVQEFSHKKKLAKSDSKISDELRLSLRRAQHQIENLDALLKLELTQGQMPKVVEITQ